MKATAPARAALASLALARAALGQEAGVTPVAVAQPAAAASLDSGLAPLGPSAAPAAGPLLHVSGLIQTDWVVAREDSLDEIDPATGAALNQERFLLRRARLRLDAAYAFALGRLELDLNSLQGVVARPFEVALGVGWAAAGPVRWLGAGRDGRVERNATGPSDERPLALLASAGLLRIPFGFDAVEAPTLRPMLERSRMVRALFPGQRDLGLGLDVEYRAFRLSAALLNGSPIGEASGDAADYAASKDVVARVGVDVTLGDVLHFEAGFSGAAGRGVHPGTATTKDQLAWTDGNEDGLVELSELSVIPGAPATASRTFAHFALGADARVALELPVLGALELRGELIRAENLDRGLEPADPVAAGRDLRELGFALGASQQLTRYALLALRFERYDPDADARQVRGLEIVPHDPAYATWSFAAQARIAPLRFIVQYDRERNALGRGRSGEPTTLASDGVTVRAELALP